MCNCGILLHMEQDLIWTPAEVGKVGELIAAKYLKSRGHLLIDRNYRKKWGEIDIVSRETNGRLHFSEVKTVSYETKELLKQAVTRRTFRPEENVHEFKLQRLYRIIETWLVAHQQEKSDWVIDILAVRIVPRERYATVKYIKNIIM